MEHHGRLSTNEKDETLNGLKLRNKLKQGLQDHDLHRSRKAEWDKGKYICINKIKFNQILNN